MARSSALVAGLLVAVAVAGTTTLFAASIAMPRPAGDGAARIEAVRIDGAARGDSAGFALSGAGDVDGDGTPDVIVGAFAATADGKAFAGETYVVMGRTIRAAFRGTAGEGIDLRGMGPGEGVRILGREPHDRSGVAVSAAGDMDGDGLGEILVGAHFAGRADGDRLAGETVVLFGRTLARAAARPGSTIRLDALEAREGVTIVGPPGGNRSGWSVADAGDVDGDGLGDVIVGSHARKGVPGLAFVVFGKAIARAAGGSGEIDLAALPPGDGVVLVGAEEDDYAGLDVAAAGDVDGDGLGDVLVGAFGTGRGGDSRAGAVHVVSGAAIRSASLRQEPRLLLGALSPREGVLVRGIAAGDNAGRAVAGAGDVDGDGLADILVGAWSAEPGGRQWSGETTLVLGARLAAELADGDGTVDLAALPGTDGVVIRGAEADDFAGWSVAGAGDVDGDGNADVVVGAYGAGRAGAAYVLFGRALAARAREGSGAAVELGRLGAGEGVRVDGATSGSNAGFRVAAAGDVDGDGLADVLVGAPYADLPGAREAAGESFAVTGAAILAASRAGGVVRLPGRGDAPLAVGAAEAPDRAPKS